MTRGEKKAKLKAQEHECCGTPAWRGRLCSYHQGIEDGYDLALEDMGRSLYDD